jgi:outer membrane protein with beta-barrel domain
MGAVMNVRILSFAAGVIVLAVSPAAAQRTGTIEVGAMARFTDYDNSLVFSNTLGIGGRVGVFLPAGFSVEGDVSRTSNSLPGGSVTYMPVHALLLYNYRIGESSLFAGGGYVHNKYGYSGGADTTDSGIAVSVGVRYHVRNMVALRLDLNEDFIPHPANEGPAQSFNGNLGMELGVSILIGLRK